MDKTESIINYITNLTREEQVELHNNYCHHTNRQDNIIHPLNQDSIDMYFGRAINLFNALRKSRHFNLNAEFFYIMNDNEISSEIDDIIDIDAIVNYLIDWGDYHFPLKELNQYLEENLIDYAHDLVCDKFSYEEVEDIITNSEIDYLMNDWDDIVKELFELVKICPNCKTAIFSTDEHFYNYDSARLVYLCRHCGEEVLE